MIWTSKNKDETQQRWHHEKYEYDEQKDHNNGTPYAQDYIPEKHIQLTGQLVWCAHEKEEEHSMCSQKHEDDHKQHGTHGELLQDTCLEDEMRIEDWLNRLQ